MRSVVVAGALANKPGNGGEAWVRLSWVRGLAALGCDVRLVEVLDPDTAHDGAGRRCRPEHSVQAAWFRRVTDAAGLARRAALVTGAGTAAGPRRDEVVRWVDGADLLVDVSGHLALGAPELFARVAITLFVDVDPGYTQVWQATGLPTGLGRHRFHATVGLLVGRAGSEVPTEVGWLPVPPPVTLADWPVAGWPAPGAAFTTVTTWRSGYGPLRWQGRELGGKHRAWRAAAALPALVPGIPLEVATCFDAADAADEELLRAHGWRVADAGAVAGTPDAFRRYVQASAGEWSVAQGAYVGLRTGWISDRTVRYLASGRPAVVEDTGAGAVVPVGEGLVTFTDVGEAAEALRRVAARWGDHARAARRLAETCFDARVVLRRVLEHCGLAVGP